MYDVKNPLLNSQNFCFIHIYKVETEAAQNIKYKEKPVLEAGL